MMNKEARENRDISRVERKQQIAGKEKKLQTDNKSIDQQKEEAAERAEQQMQAAATSYWLGILSAGAATNTAVPAVEAADSTKRKPANTNRVVKPSGNTDQRKEVNDAAARLLSQIGNINKVAGLR